jgi:Na+-driven multidrug efflux pump
VVNSFGKVAVAAFTATSRIEQIIHQPYQTLGAALSTFTGQNYGARKKERITQGYRSGLLLMVIFSVLMLPVMQFFGEGIISIFVEEKEVIEMGAVALKITSYFYVMLGLIYVVRGVLNGLGDSIFALLNGIVEVIGRFIVPIALTRIPAIGLWGIWWSVGIVWSLSGITAWMRYMSYKKVYENM